MTAPRFIERVLDSTVSVLGEVDRSAVVEHISSALIALRCAEDLVPASREGFLLGANLAARLYPMIYLDAADELAQAAAEEIALINPRCKIEKAAGPATTTLNYECPVRGKGEIAVFARGWNVYVDCEPEEPETVHAPAALLAATLGLGEAFRAVFAPQLGERGRHGTNPFSFNMITLTDPIPGPPWSEGPKLGRFNLVGAGAIGQAAAHTLAVCRAEGTMVAIDYEAITLSNLQRYLLTHDADIGAVKVKLLKKRLASAQLQVVPQRSMWEVGRASKGVPSLVALDSGQARIELQAALPGAIYNAWTQPGDVGFSRHEEFGEEPCLACLYWPTQARPSRYEQVAVAFNQHPARCLAYLVHCAIPVGAPLPAIALQALPDSPNPPEAIEWTQRPILRRHRRFSRHRSKPARRLAGALAGRSLPGWHLRRRGARSRRWRGTTRGAGSIGPPVGLRRNHAGRPSCLPGPIRLSARSGPLRSKAAMTSSPPAPRCLPVRGRERPVASAPTASSGLSMLTNLCNPRRASRSEQ